MRHVPVGFLALCFLIPATALAHTKWFAGGEVPQVATSEPTVLYLFVWGLILVAVVAIAVFVDRFKFARLPFLEPRAPHMFPRAAATFSMVAGAFFVIAGTHEYLFSPNLSLESGVPAWLIYLQIFIGLSFLVGACARISALALLALWMTGVLAVGVEVMVENIWVASTALFILFMGNDYFSLVPFKLIAHYVRPYKHYALPILRIGTGVTLVVLGFSEKILRPELGVNFLAQYDWNFMHLLGFEWYTDYLFTISAGSVEILFGLIFILGVVTRINAIVLALFFTTPLFILGPIELAGHLPHFAAVILLIFFGSGDRFLFMRRGSHHIAVT